MFESFLSVLYLRWSVWPHPARPEPSEPAQHEPTLPPTLSELLQSEGGQVETPLHKLLPHLLVVADIWTVDAAGQAAVSRPPLHCEGQHIWRGIQVKSIQYGGRQLPQPALLDLQGDETASVQSSFLWLLWFWRERTVKLANIREGVSSLVGLMMM